MQNRRAAVRFEFDREGWLVAVDGSVDRACRLRNISARGARVTLSDHADLPERIVLRIPADGTSWPCRIVRRQETEVGVLFT